MNKHILFVVLFFGVFLVSCSGWPTPEMQARAEAVLTDARIKEADATQERIQDADIHQNDMAKAAYWAELRGAWQGFVQFVGQAFLSGLAAVVIISAIATSITATQVIPAIGVSFVKFVDMRAGIVPIDVQTRLPRQVIFDTSHMLTDESFLGKVGEKFGFRLRHIRGKQYAMWDGATGEFVTKFDVERPVNDIKAETVRQVIWLAITMTNMKKADPETASYMGAAYPNVGGTSVLALDKILKEMQNEISN